MCALTDSYSGPENISKNTIWLKWVMRDSDYADQIFKVPALPAVAAVTQRTFTNLISRYFITFSLENCFILDIKERRSPIQIYIIAKYIWTHGFIKFYQTPKVRSINYIFILQHPIIRQERNLYKLSQKSTFLFLYLRVSILRCWN